ncbi:MAG: MarR family winged helix-turn-helix transcriptional regulator [Candidatus Dormibacteraceae bacterium]
MNVLAGTTSESVLAAQPLKAQEVQRLLHEMQHVLHDARRAHSPQGVTLGEAQWSRSVLITIARNPNVTINEIARQVEAPKSRVSVLVSTLVERGIVSRQADEHDRRLVHVALTEKGTARLRHLRERYERAFSRMLAPLSEDDLDTIARGLELLLHVLRPAIAEEGFMAKEDRSEW